MTFCNICVYSEGEDIKKCSICNEHLCKGVIGRSVCSDCLIKCNKYNLLQKNSIGQYLDPLLRVSLSTCICGKIIVSFSDCIIKMINGDNNHKMIKSINDQN